MSIDRSPYPFPTRNKPLNGRHALTRRSTVRRIRAWRPGEPSEKALDQGIEETFPASDPVAVVVDEPAGRRSEVSPSFTLAVMSVAVAAAALWWRYSRR